VAADGELVRRWVRGREQVVEEVSHPWATPPFNSADRYLNVLDNSYGRTHLWARSVETGPY
jgi:hypothetical protein